MSRRDWGAVPALGIVVVICAVWVLASWATSTTYEYNTHRDQRSQPKPYSGLLDASTFWHQHAGTTESYQSICESPIDQTQADLCQQWRSANSAESMADYAFVGMFVGVAGIIGLIWTLILSNRATKAATAATEAANRSANAAEIAYLAENRPWLAIKVETLEIAIEYGSLQIDLKITTPLTGRTPATEARFNMLTKSPSEELQFEVWFADLKAVLGADDSPNHIIVTPDDAPSFMLPCNIRLGTDAIGVNRTAGGVTYDIILLVGYSYKSTLDQTVRYTFTSFTVGAEADNEGRIRNSWMYHLPGGSLMT